MFKRKTCTLKYCIAYNCYPEPNGGIGYIIEEGSSLCSECKLHQISRSHQGLRKFKIQCECRYNKCLLTNKDVFALRDFAAAAKIGFYAQCDYLGRRIDLTEEINALDASQTRLKVMKKL
jgi:hypothetical protein